MNDIAPKRNGTMAEGCVVNMIVILLIARLHIADDKYIFPFVRLFTACLCIGFLATCFRENCQSSGHHSSRKYIGSYNEQCGRY
jgi:hypothetical protein